MPNQTRRSAGSVPFPLLAATQLDIEWREMTDHVTVSEISISRIIAPDGQLGFILTTPEKFSFIEVLGLLEAAKWQLYSQMTSRYGE